MKQRARLLNKHSEIKNGAIIYWMSRDQRVHDNWALLYAQHLAKKYDQPLVVVFCLQSSFLGATLRQFNFMLYGLQEVSDTLHDLQIPFFIIEEKPKEAFGWLAKHITMGAIVTDFSPLKIGRQWRKEIAESQDVPVIEVDAHNIIPAWLASDKQEFAAYTFRPKVNKKLDEFLVHFLKMSVNDQLLNSQLLENLGHPRLEKSKLTVTSIKEWRLTSVETLLESMTTLDRDVKSVEWCKPGEKAAHECLAHFLDNDFKNYDEDRNDPNKDAQSNLSPYLHFGHIASQTIALAVQEKMKSKSSPDSEAFLEELIVRKELSDNFCLYNQNYDNDQGFPDWAKKSHFEHKDDVREQLYTLKQLEEAETYDELWNASQLEMVKLGKMHGYMRMYWAKKILEWTKSPAQALKFAIYLNDKYELDGRDPNGYVGILWSIGGVHDRAWFEREIFGKIRYMNANGAKRKFDVEKYVESIHNI